MCVAGMSYGRHGNPTHYALEEAFAVLEGGDNAVAVSSGVAAINAAILAFVQAGDHILVSDGVYDPTRSFCDKFLAKFDVRCTYFSPTAKPPTSSHASAWASPTPHPRHTSNAGARISTTTALPSGSPAPRPQP